MKDFPLKMVDIVSGKTILVKEYLMDFCKFGYCGCKEIQCVKCLKIKKKRFKVKSVVTH